MSVTFLAPAALLAGALLAIPVVLHLFKPRKVRRTPFSSLRWLHLSQQKLARRIKWHQVILFLLRCAFIALLVLAIAKPILSSRASSGGGAVVERFIVLDVSRSMGYRAANRPTPIELGKEVAVKLINQSVGDDRAALLLTGSTTRLLGPLTPDPSSQLAALKMVDAGVSDTDLSSALPVIRPMLARKRAGARVEIDFITDNHQQSWREGAIASFIKDLDAQATTVRVIDVGVLAAQNAWIADARLISQSKPAPRKTIRVQVGCVGDAGQSRTVRITGLAGASELTQSIKMDPGKLTVAEFEIPANLNLHGQAARIAIDPGDALPDDDEFYLNLDPAGAAKVLLVEADTTRIEAMRPAFYLHAALTALASGGGRTIDVESKTPDTVTAGDIAGSDVVMLADVPELSDDNLTALDSRTKSGGGVAIFLGPDVKPTFYNTKLYRAALPSESLLASPLTTITNAPPQHLESLANIDWSHPLLAPLYDPVLGDFAQTLVRSHYQFESAPKDGVVLASIDNRAPAIIDRSVGSGRVVLFNLTANDAWSDLPRRKSFVPLIDRLLTYLAGNRAAEGGSLEAGETVTIPLSNLKSGATINVAAPGGKKLTPTMQSQNGRDVIRLDNVQTPGIYRVDVAGDPSGSRVFVVNAGRGDSVLTPTDPTLLKKWWEPANVEIASADAIQSGHAIANFGRVKLWPWLVALACLVFIAEMYLVHRLCPRMNPGVVAPVVPRRGIFTAATHQQIPEEVSVN